MYYFINVDCFRFFFSFTNKVVAAAAAEEVQTKTISAILKNSSRVRRIGQSHDLVSNKTATGFRQVSDPFTHKHACLRLGPQLGFRPTTLMEFVRSTVRGCDAALAGDSYRP
jgi:hypothetical protein